MTTQRMPADQEICFILDGTEPTRLVVRDTAPPDWVTRTFSVIADYGWAERILCSECYRHDADAIAIILADRLGITAELAS